MTFMTLWKRKAHLFEKFIPEEIGEEHSYFKQQPEDHVG